jgi:hypothetical protein
MLDGDDKHVERHTKTAPQEDALDASGYAAVCGMLSGHDNLFRGRSWPILYCGMLSGHDNLFRGRSWPTLYLSDFLMQEGRAVMEKASSGLRLMLCDFG